MFAIGLFGQAFEAGHHKWYCDRRTIGTLIRHHINGVGCHNASGKSLRRLARRYLTYYLA
ncbi:hypothetical protein O9992_01140 [Vibrio lentus]|nr:hypothetical protein [Vibrio lentus]